MGLLSEGSPMTWTETKKMADHVRKHGIIQFINQYNKLKERSKDCLLWGDEIEYMLVNLDPEKRKAYLLLKALPMLHTLNEAELKNPVEVQTLWRPEYASYMVEGTPGRPYGHRMAHFNIVEANMKKRREEVMRLLSDDPNSYAMTLTSFPRLGCLDFSKPPTKPNPVDGVSRSLFFPDEVIFQGHPRFRTLTRNIRERRGEKPAINIPIFRDEKTPNPFLEKIPEEIFPNSSNGITRGNNSLNLNKMDLNKDELTELSQDRTENSEKTENSQVVGSNSYSLSTKNYSGEDIFVNSGGECCPGLPDHIYMDCMGFGMGCCCLQVTFQACNIFEAKVLYDQLTTLCPIMLALSAASPIYRGYLADQDCRWNVISGAVDDRTKQERGLELLKSDRFVIPKSRYDSVSSYLSPCSTKYNDIDLVFEPNVCQTLLDAGIDKQLSEHIAHLFIRDPISLFQEKLDQDDNEDTDHFENIQSTNWQTMRFKPPPPNTDIGWRVEFRPMEVQLTDFENAAYVVFVVLLTRVILSYRLNFLIPISKVDENMKRAQKRNACLEQKFYFRKDVLTSYTPKEAENLRCCNDKRFPKESGEPTSQEEEYDEFTIKEIICGKPGVFAGLKPLIESYLKSIDDCDVDTSCTISQYLNLISLRASGELLTTASWMREFVQSHPDYKRDSLVTDPIAYDLLLKCARVVNGGEDCPKLISKRITKTNESLPHAMKNVDKHLANMAAIHHSGVGDGLK